MESLLPRSGKELFAHYSDAGRARGSQREERHHRRLNQVDATCGEVPNRQVERLSKRMYLLTSLFWCNRVGRLPFKNAARGFFPPFWRLICHSTVSTR